MSLRPCKDFNTAQGCKWGKKCRFSHGAAPAPAHVGVLVGGPGGGVARSLDFASDSGAQCSQPQSSDDRVWVPPCDLQRIDVPVPEGASYTLFFPIELTNKDCKIAPSCAVSACLFLNLICRPSSHLRHCRPGHPGHG